MAAAGWPEPNPHAAGAVGSLGREGNAGRETRLSDPSVESKMAVKRADYDQLRSELDRSVAAIVEEGDRQLAGLVSIIKQLRQQASTKTGGEQLIAVAAYCALFEAIEKLREGGADV